MKTHCLAIGSLVFPLLTSAYAEVVNRVTVAGTFTYPSQPVEKSTPTSHSSTQYLVKVGITNNTILDAMVSEGDLTTKRGYLLIEIFCNDGETKGYYAWNPTTGDVVEVDCDIMKPYRTKGEAAAVSCSRTQVRQTTTLTEAVSFHGLGSMKLLGVKACVFYTGSALLKGATYSSLPVTTGEQQRPGYYLINYIATVRGVNCRDEENTESAVSSESESENDSDEIIDAVISSAGGVLNNNIFQQQG